MDIMQVTFQFCSQAFLWSSLKLHVYKPNQFKRKPEDFAGIEKGAEWPIWCNSWLGEGIRILFSSFWS